MPDHLDSTHDSAGTGRGFYGGLALVALVALTLRVAFTLAVSRHISVIGDAQTYHLLANNLAAGKGYIRPHDAIPTPTAEFPPLFPAVLAVVARLGGTGIEAQRIVTSFLGAAGVVMIGLLGRRVAGPVVGLTAAGIAAVYPMLLQADTSLMAESLYVPLIAATLLMTYMAIDSPSPGRWLGAGTLVALATLTRTEAIALVPLMIVPEALRRSGPDLRRRLVAAALVCAATGLVLAPWLIRNMTTFDRFVPVSNNSGTLLAGSSCDRVYSGPQKGLWRLDCIDEVSPTADMNEADVAAQYRREGVDYMRSHSGEVPGVVAVRVLRTFGLWDPSGQIAWETFEGRDQTWQTVGHRFFLVLAPLGVGGVVLLARRGRPWWPLVAPVVLVAMTSAMSYGSQRFRIVAEPGIVVAASVSLVALGTWIRSRLGGAPASQVAKSANYNAEDSNGE